VLENNGGVDLLLGLDMLRKHQVRLPSQETTAHRALQRLTSCSFARFRPPQCVIDLRETALRIGDEVVPFLSEKDIPRYHNAPLLHPLLF
jgi:hypothetical protein